MLHSRPGHTGDSLCESVDFSGFRGVKCALDDISVRACVELICAIIIVVII